MKKLMAALLFMASLESLAEVEIQVEIPSVENCIAKISNHFLDNTKIGGAPRLSVKWSGGCKDGFIEGSGTLETYLNSDLIGTEIGYFVKGGRSGKYLAKQVGGFLYDGEFMENKIHGYGKFTYANGSIYEGNFVKGIREGRGTLVYKGNISYEGNFYKDRPDGYFLMKVPLGKETRVAQLDNKLIRGDVGVLFKEGKWIEIYENCTSLEDMEKCVKQKTSAVDAIKRNSTDVIRGYSIAQNRSRRAELTEKMNKTSCYSMGGFQICSGSGMRDNDVLMSEWTELCELDPECNTDLQAKRRGSNNSARETKIIGDKFTDGGKRREVWGWCANGKEFSGSKWNNDNYWTMRGNNKGVVQPSNISLDGVIEIICN